MEINTQQLKELALWLDGLYEGRGKNILPLGVNHLENLWNVIRECNNNSIGKSMDQYIRKTDLKPTPPQGDYMVSINDQIKKGDTVILTGLTVSQVMPDKLKVGVVYSNGHKPVEIDVFERDLRQMKIIL